jgi:spermidine dehydrogenase
MTHKADGDGIDRRDFLNGLLLAAGGAAVGGFSPMSAFAHSGVGINTGDGGIGFDPRARRGGNLPEVFNVGHWMRDERLTFSPTKVNIKPAPYDNYQGNHDIVTDTGNYDVIVMGSGMSGLSAAFYLQRRRPGTRVLLLDANAGFGGNAGRDDAAPIPVVSATGGAYAVDPYADFLTDIYGTTGVDWESNYITDPFYCYFFDDRTPHVIPGTRSWTRDVYGAGTDDMPYPTPILNHLKQAKQDFRNWYNRAGAPTDPADDSDPRFDYLAHKSLHEYLTVEKGFHPAVSDFYTRFAVDALAGTSHDVNAYTSISFIAAEYNPVFTLPGGTSGIARHILNWLIPAAINGNSSEDILANPINTSKLDLVANTTRIRQKSMVVRADNTSSGAKVTYFRDGKFYRASAPAVILAGQYHTTHRVIEHMLTPALLNAWLSFTLAPVPIANVTLKKARPLVDLGLGFNQYWWGSKFWADFVISDWIGPNRHDPERQTVLTFYGANELPPGEMAHDRVNLLRRPFSEYENSLREDLERVLTGTGFDFDSDVSAVYLYRWGHGMVYPKIGFPFGVPTYQGGQAIRTPAPRHIAREAMGRISFAGQDVESSPAIESAIASGLRTADEALAHL